MHHLAQRRAGVWHQVELGDVGHVFPVTRLQARVTHHRDHRNILLIVTVRQTTNYTIILRNFTALSHYCTWDFRPNKWLVWRTGPENDGPRKNNSWRMRDLEGCKKTSSFTERS